MYQKQDNSLFKHLDFLILDLLVLQISYMLSYILRHGFRNGGTDPVYFYMAGVLMMIQILVSVFGESYKDILQRGYLEEMKNVFLYNTAVMVLVFTFMFFTKMQAVYSRLVFVQLWALCIFFMYGERLVWKRIVRNKVRSSNELPRLLVIGHKDSIEESILQLMDKKYQSFKIVGAVVYDCSMKGNTISDIPVVADWDEIFDYSRKEVVDEVFLNIQVDNQVRKIIVNRFLEMGIAVHINLEDSWDELPNKEVQNLGEFSVLTTSIKTATAYQLFVKRLMDIVGSLFGLAGTGILFLFLAPVIYIQSPGPIFFSQERVGRNGRRFRIYKFRSMYMDAEERKKELMSQNKMSGLMFKMDDDPRIFPAGKIIRKLSLDEFPQFWNVLKGDMSLVGTRPPTVDEFEQYEAHHKMRLSIKPGLTGMWQVSGRSDITDFEEVVRLDNQYIAKWNLQLDIKILFQTVAVVLGSRGSV